MTIAVLSMPFLRIFRKRVLWRDCPLMMAIGKTPIAVSLVGLTMVKKRGIS